MKFNTLAAASIAALTVAMPAVAETTVKIAGFGASSGVVGVFGQNSSAAMQAATETINAEGGITLANSKKP